MTMKNRPAAKTGSNMFLTSSAIICNIPSQGSNIPVRTTQRLPLRGWHLFRLDQRDGDFLAIEFIFSGGGIFWRSREQQPQRQRFGRDVIHVMLNGLLEPGAGLDVK